MSDGAWISESTPFIIIFLIWILLIVVTLFAGLVFFPIYFIRYTLKNRKNRRKESEEDALDKNRDNAATDR